jgi:hypothetical protein
MVDVSPTPDPRWQNFIGGLDDHGRPKPMTYEALLAVTAEWPVSQQAPEGIVELLATARAAFALAWFHYELLVVSASWSLLAVEAALRDRLDVDEKPPLKALVARATKAGLLDDATADRLDAGRQLRNGLAHARAQQAWTVGMAGPVVRTSHEVVRLLYPDSPA